MITTYFINYDLICRHLMDRSDMYDDGCIGVGYRFHSFLGEPRDAFVFLSYALALYGLLLVFEKNRNFSFLYILLLISIMALTQSASGLVGLIIGFIIVFMFGDFYKYKNIIYLNLLIILFILTVTFIVYTDTRLNLYIQEAKNLFVYLENRIITDLILIQSNDIIPMWMYIKQLINLDLFHVLFGSGSGSASFTTNEYLAVEQFINKPRSNLVRVLFASGLIGMFFYLKFLIHPLKILVSEIDSKYKTYFLYSSFIFYGCTFGHRSLLGFIFVGIIVTILVNKLHKQDEKKN